MSDDLQKALGVIEKGAEERMEVLKEKKQKLEEGAGEPSTMSETVPKLIGHIKKMEVEDVEAEKEEEVQDDRKEVDKGTAGVAGKETGEDGGALKPTTNLEKAHTMTSNEICHQHERSKEADKNQGAGT